MARHTLRRPEAVFVTHEHGDHYIGLDELFVFKRNVPRDSFEPIPVYMSSLSWSAVSLRFAYLEQMGVIVFRPLEPGGIIKAGSLEVSSFKTYHGKTAAGSIGLVLECPSREGVRKKIVYTSDFEDIPEIPPHALNPDILIIQTFWLNEPVHNRPSHMSLQRALLFIERFSPKAVYITHIGEADMAEGDPWNSSLKKYAPKDPLRPPTGGAPYPIPRCQQEWDQTLARVLEDRKIAIEAHVSFDDMCIKI